MTKASQCDKCGKVFNYGSLNVVSFFKSKPLDLEFKSFTLNKAQPRIELCDSCFKSVMQYATDNQ